MTLCLCLSPWSWVYCNERKKTLHHRRATPTVTELACWRNSKLAYHAPSQTPSDLVAKRGGGGRGLSSCMHVPAFAQTSLPRCAHIKIVISPVSALADPACLLFPSVAERSSASSSWFRMFRSACFTGSFRRCDRGVPVFFMPLLSAPLSASLSGKKM